MQASYGQLSVGETGDIARSLANRNHTIQMHVNVGSLFSTSQQSEKGWKNNTSLQHNFTHVITIKRISGGMETFFSIQTLLIWKKTKMTQKSISKLFLSFTQIQTWRQKPPNAVVDHICTRETLKKKNAAIYIVVVPMNSPPRRRVVDPRIT